LATSGEHLRIWKVNKENARVDIKAELKNVSGTFTFRLINQNFHHLYLPLIGT